MFSGSLEGVGWVGSDRRLGSRLDGLALGVVCM